MRSLKKKVYILAKRLKELGGYNKQYNEIKAELSKITEILLDMRIDQFKSTKRFPDIIEISNGQNDISEYWTGHTVHDGWFVSEKESIDYCKERFNMYPCFRQMAEMDRNHDGEVLLDYGCGPGNDLVWYSYKNNLNKIIGMDVSRTALCNAQFRLALGKKDIEKIELYHIDENEKKLPIRNESVDFISCQGVLMHTSNPESILREFNRVLRTSSGEESQVCIMVYNKSSIWYHLYVAYYLKYINVSRLYPLLQKEILNMEQDEIFRRSTDGIECPRALCWTPEEFTEMCKKAGFSRVEYRGGYPDSFELGIAKKYLAKAIKDKRVKEEHKKFLLEVHFDDNGYPVYKGKLCCIGGVYHLWK